MASFMGAYVSERAKGNIKQYKYDGCDHSIIANRILQPFWRQAVEWLPIWMAPNLITLLGFFGIIISYIITVSYAPSLQGNIPSWVSIFNVVAIWWYQTMDALDGKQARRTNSSSGLGELFDHGCDAITTFLVVLTFLTSVQAGINLITLFNVLIMLTAFYMTQWEQYHTDRMELGYIGVTEGQISMMVGHLITLFLGTEFWSSFIPGTAIPQKYVPIFFSTLGAVLTITTNITTVIKKGPKSVKGSIFQIIPIALVWSIGMLWAYNSPSKIYELNPHTYIITFGFIVAFLVGRIVLARICCDELHPFQIVLTPLFLLAIDYLIPSFDMFGFIGVSETTFLQVYCIAIFIVYIHFAYVVVTALCKVLNIYCFKLKPVKLK